MTRRIAFVINSIGSGGAERVLDIILRERPKWAADYVVDLVLLDQKPEMRVMAPVDGKHVLDARGSLLRSIAQLHTRLSSLSPDLVVSFLIRSNLAAACWRLRGGNAPVVACERMHVSSHLKGRYGTSVRAMLRLALMLGYRHCDRVLAVSQGVADDLHRHFRVPEAHLSVVPNPYDPTGIATAAQGAPVSELPEEYIVAVGRMVGAKNFAGLIDAYAIADPAYDLVILGNGPERGALERQVRAKGLDGRVHMPGYLVDPLPVVSRARFFVSASRNEGFPNAVAEAMALRLSVLSTDCPSGPAELLLGSAGEPGTAVRAEAGLLVPMDDIPALAQGIALLSTDPGLRDELGEAALRRIGDFPQERIVAQYWNHLRQMLDR